MAKRLKAKIEGGQELMKALQGLDVNVRNALVQAADAGAEVIRAEAARRAPGPYIVKSYQWNKRFRKNRADFQIGPDREHRHYYFFEVGTRPHVIKPKDRKGLAFLGRAGQIVRRSVKHPGMAARPFLRPAMDASKDQAVEAVKSELQAVIVRNAHGD